MNGKMRGEIAERKNRKGKIMLKEIFTCCDYCYNCNCNEVSLNSISGVSEKDIFLGEPSYHPSLIVLFVHGLLHQLQKTTSSL